MPIWTQTNYKEWCSSTGTALIQRLGYHRFKTSAWSLSTPSNLNGHINQARRGFTQLSHTRNREVDRTYQKSTQAEMGQDRKSCWGLPIWSVHGPHGWFGLCHNAQQQIPSTWEPQTPSQRLLFHQSYPNNDELIKCWTTNATLIYPTVSAYNPTSCDGQHSQTIWDSPFWRY